MQIAERCVASFHYTLTDDAGTVIDSSEGREPLAYLHGAGNIVPGLEKAMAGRAAGEQFKVTVAPEEGYGLHNEQLIQSVPREAFQGVDNIEPGMRFQAQTQNGPVNVEVKEVAEQTVTIDGNHPLAGKALHFDVTVAEVREASEEELSHGHVHGVGGAH